MISRFYQTYLNGTLVAEGGQSLLPDLRSEHINNFACTLKNPADFKTESPSDTVHLRVIEVLDGQLITNTVWEQVATPDGVIKSDVDRDILKITVVNRYADAPPATAFIRNFGLKTGAIASTVGHDSHNIIAVGCDDESLCQAVNSVIETRGGVSAVGRGQTHRLPLPIAGLMSDADGYWVAESYTQIDHFVKNGLGSTLISPFMSLSFMALLVIPALKLSDKGLFDGDRFNFVPLYG